VFTLNDVKIINLSESNESSITRRTAFTHKSDKKRRIDGIQRRVKLEATAWKQCALSWQPIQIPDIPVETCQNIGVASCCKEVHFLAGMSWRHLEALEASNQAIDVPSTPQKQEGGTLSTTSRDKNWDWDSTTMDMVSVRKGTGTKSNTLELQQFRCFYMCRSVDPLWSMQCQTRDFLLKPRRLQWKNAAKAWVRWRQSKEKKITNELEIWDIKKGQSAGSQETSTTRTWKINNTGRAMIYFLCTLIFMEGNVGLTQDCATTDASTKAGMSCKNHMDKSSWLWNSLNKRGPSVGMAQVLPRQIWLGRRKFP
jgi:hypothetical protein